MKNFVLASVLVLSLGYSVIYKCTITFSMVGREVSIPCAYICVAIAALCFILERATIVRNRLAKDRAALAADAIQRAISAMLVKDTVSLKRYILKTKALTNDHPLVFWLEGHLALLENKNVDAKASLYKALTEEKDSSLGAYSLYMFYKQNGTCEAALETLDHVMDKYPHAPEITRQAVLMHIQNNNIPGVLKYTQIMQKHKHIKDHELAAIYCYVGLRATDPEYFEKAYSLDKSLSFNSLQYAKCLILQNNTKKARKVLLKTFSQTPDRELFREYADTLNQDENVLKSASKLLNANECWEGHYEYAMLAFKNKAYMIAYLHMLKAYNLQPYRLIYEMLERIYDHVDHNDESLDVSWQHSQCVDVEFAWQCGKCKNTSTRWEPVCLSCGEIASFHRVAISAYDAKYELNASKLTQVYSLEHKDE